MSEEPALDKGSLGKGFQYAAIANVIAAVVGAITIFVGIGVVILAGFAVIQLVWLVPMYLKFRSAGATETAKGIVIVAGITVLLSGGCYAMLLNGRLR